MIHQAVSLAHTKIKHHHVIQIRTVSANSRNTNTTVVRNATITREILVVVIHVNTADTLATKGTVHTKINMDITVKAINTASIISIKDIRISVMIIVALVTNHVIHHVITRVITIQTIVAAIVHITIIMMATEGMTIMMAMVEDTQSMGMEMMAIMTMTITVTVEDATSVVENAELVRNIERNILNVDTPKRDHAVNQGDVQGNTREATNATTGEPQKPAESSINQKIIC